MTGTGRASYAALRDAALESHHRAFRRWQRSVTISHVLTVWAGLVVLGWLVSMGRMLWLLTGPGVVVSPAGLGAQIAGGFMVVVLSVGLSVSAWRVRGRRQGALWDLQKRLRALDALPADGLVAGGG